MSEVLIVHGGGRVHTAEEYSGMERERDEAREAMTRAKLEAQEAIRACGWEAQRGDEARRLLVEAEQVLAEALESADEMLPGMQTRDRAALLLPEIRAHLAGGER